MAERDYEFYLVPSTMDPHTNECIARELANLTRATGSEVTFFDNKGIERSGWRVQHAVLMAFCKAAAVDKRFKVMPFVKEGGGKPHLYSLPGIKRKDIKRRQAEKDGAKAVELKKTKIAQSKQ